jgi:hypothetical protein
VIFSEDRFARHARARSGRSNPFFLPAAEEKMDCHAGFAGAQ